MIGSIAAWSARLSSSLFGSPQHNRLKHALEGYEVQRKCRKQMTRGPSRNICEQAVNECVEEAKRALEKFDFDSGWQNLHTAQSMEIWDYDDREVLDARQVLCEEASKLSGWRRAAIVKLVGPASDGSSTQKDFEVLRRDLYAATLVKNEQFNNLYYKIGQRGRNLKIAFFTLAVIVIALPIMAGSGLLWVSSSDWKMILAVEFTGIFGASLSVASSLTKSSVDESIPQQILGSVVTWMRPVMGAAAAVVAYLLFQAGALPPIIKADSNPTLVAFVIAFVAGFSERFIIGAVQKILPSEK